jgi:DNA-binding helix-hairpin-helix protein with protein kinase domain
MIANPVQQAGGHFWVTWPVDIILTSGRSPQFAGYTMRKLTQAKPIFTFYNPAIRLKQCPGFDYRNLVRCGRNLAAAFNQAHSQRYVIGDANESNVFISNDGLGTLIDVDSWQIAAGGRIYRSPVAKSDFLPPELQNRNLKSIVRLPCHDNFALAVLLFKLTSEGTHPFDGIYRAAGDVPPLEARIAANSFPYRDKSGRWSPKKLALPFGSLHPRLQSLFLQAFVAGHSMPQSRPDARAWQEAFTVAERDLRVCQQNSQHWFWGNECPWCQRKILLGGLDPFPNRNQKTQIPGRCKPMQIEKQKKSAPPAPAIPDQVQLAMPIMEIVVILALLLLGLCLLWKFFGALAVILALLAVLLVLAMLAGSARNSE